jgi:hypothetical protein
LANGWDWEGSDETKVAFDKTVGDSHVAFGDFQFIEKAISKVEMAASSVQRKAHAEGHWTAELRRMVGDLVVLVTKLLHREREFKASTAPPALQGKMGGIKQYKQYGVIDSAAAHRAAPGYEAQTAAKHAPRIPKHGVVSPPQPLSANSTQLSAGRSAMLGTTARTGVKTTILAANASAHHIEPIRTSADAAAAVVAVVHASINASTQVDALQTDLQRLRDLLQAMRSLLYHGKGVPQNMISATREVRAKLEAMIAHKYTTVTLRPTLSPDTTKSPSSAATVVTYRY